MLVQKISQVRKIISQDAEIVEFVNTTHARNSRGNQYNVFNQNTVSIHISRANDFPRICVLTLNYYLIKGYESDRVG